MSDSYDAIIVGCIDPRFQGAMNSILDKVGLGSAYRFLAAGAQRNFVNVGTRAMAMRQIGIAVAHGARDVYLIAHMDCADYGGSGAFTSSDAERTRLAEDLNQAEKVIGTVHKNLRFIKKILFLDTRRGGVSAYEVK